jgi:outer membrane protein assembly factor BamA
MRAIRNSRLGRGAALAAVLIIVALPSAQAQRWVDSRYPYITSGANDFPMLAGRMQWTQPVDDYLSPLPYFGNLSIDAGISFNSSYFATAQLRLPRLKDGWRLAANAAIVREARLGFFGIGNNSTYDQDLVNDNQPFFYRVRRKRQLVNGEVTRRISGPFHVSAALGYQRSLLSDLPGPSVFRAQFPSEVMEDDFTARVSLIFDTRDSEYNTTRGVQAEAGVSTGSGGTGYRRVYGIVRGFVSPRAGTVIGGRIGGAAMTDGPPLHARFELPIWENTMTIFGGDDTHRSYDEGRFTGEHVLFSNLEIRHNILDLATLGSISVLVFIDAGRVFEQENFRITTDDLKVGGGAGIGIRVLRSTMFTFNLAKGDEGWNFTMNSGWLF